MVIVLTACPARLRGHLTRWLLEISAGVFVGHVTSRVRKLLWARVIELSGDGRALMVHTMPGEQRLSFQVYGHHWEPVDHDGITLIRRPSPEHVPNVPSPPVAWSKVGARRRFARRTPGAPGRDPDTATGPTKSE